MSSYDIINHSILYYRLNGFKYIEVPWLVNEDVSNITKPIEKKNLFILKFPCESTTLLKFIITY